MLKRPLFFSAFFIYFNLFLINPAFSAGREVEPGNVTYSEPVPCLNCRSTAYFITLSGGVFRPVPIDAKTVSLTPSIDYRYNYNNQSKNNGTIELFFGVERFLEQGFKGQFGGEIAFISPQFTGTVYQLTTPSVRSNFSYKLNSARYAFKTKFLVDLLYQFSAYGSGSAGASVNTAKDFSLTNHNNYRPAHYTEQTEINFGWSLGAGLERLILENWRFGVGYEFAGWGAHEFGRADWQTQNHGLGNKLYTNTLLLSLTFIV